MEQTLLLNATFEPLRSSTGRRPSRSGARAGGDHRVARPRGAGRVVQPAPAVGDPPASLRANKKTIRLCAVLARQHLRARPASLPVMQQAPRHAGPHVRSRHPVSQAAARTGRTSSPVVSRAIAARAAARPPRLACTWSARRGGRMRRRPFASPSDYAARPRAGATTCMEPRTRGRRAGLIVGQARMEPGAWRRRRHRSPWRHRGRAPRRRGDGPPAPSSSGRRGDSRSAVSTCGRPSRRSDWSAVDLCAGLARAGPSRGAGLLAAGRDALRRRRRPARSSACMLFPARLISPMPRHRRRLQRSRGQERLSLVDPAWSPEVAARRSSKAFVGRHGAQLFSRPNGVLTSRAGQRHCSPHCADGTDGAGRLLNWLDVALAFAPMARLRRRLELHHRPSLVHAGAPASRERLRTSLAQCRDVFTPRIGILRKARRHRRPCSPTDDAVFIASTPWSGRSARRHVRQAAGPGL